MNDDGTIIWPVGKRQQFAPDALASGMNVGLFNGVPSTVQNGDMWYWNAQSGLFVCSANVSFPLRAQDSREPDLKLFKAGTPAAVFSAAEDTDRWLFNDSTDQFIQLQTAIPYSFGNSGSSFTVEMWFSMATANSGNVVMGCQVMSMPGTATEDSNSNGYAAVVSSTGPVPTTVGAVAQININSVNRDSANTASAIKLRIFRDADNASDTATGDFELIAVRLFWLRN